MFSSPTPPPVSDVSLNVISSPAPSCTARRNDPVWVVQLPVSSVLLLQVTDRCYYAAGQTPAIDAAESHNKRERDRDTREIFGPVKT